MALKLKIRDNTYEPIKGPYEDNETILTELAKRSPYDVKIFYKTTESIYKVKDVSPDCDSLTILDRDDREETGWQTFGTHTTSEHVVPCLRSLHTITNEEVNELVGLHGLGMIVQYDYAGIVTDIIAPQGIENYNKLMDWLYKKQFNTILPRNAYIELPEEYYE